MDSSANTLNPSVASMGEQWHSQALSEPAASRPGAIRLVALVGAGNIAAAHADALAAIGGVKLAGVVDPLLARAEALAQRHDGALAASTLKDLVGRQSIDALHILTPPNLHRDLVLEALEMGLPTLVEKPMASDRAGADEMLAAAAARRAGAPPLYVNHNFVFNPAFVRLLETIRTGRIGKLVSISCTYGMPLRQLAAGQFHHWMFARPANLLLEQAVHPFSQVLTLTGPAKRFQVLAGPPHQVPAASPIPQSLSVQVEGEVCTAQVYLHFGATYPVWQITATCSDGVASADMLRNRVEIHEQSESVEPLDNLKDAVRSAGSVMKDGLTGLTAYGLSLLGMGGRADPFYLAMKQSLSAFHTAGASDLPWVNNAEGARCIVHLCEDIAATAFGEAHVSKKRPAPQSAFQAQAIVTGGTGFIGREIVRVLTNRGLRVAVVARNASAAGDLFDSDLVRICSGDVRNAPDMARIMDGAEFVINAAGPQVTEDWADCQRNVEESVNGLADACMAAKVRKVIHLSSIAALYLGGADSKLDGATPVDPRPELRPNYSRAKALGEALLLKRWSEQGLPVTILRPGVVVGKGGIALHTGVGLFVNDRHCIGWSQGTNALPFVLAEDVAAACLGALDNDVGGRCFNLVGNVGLTAREYVEELGAALDRPLVFHPVATQGLYVTEIGKWIIKRIGGRKVPAPSLRDLRSRAMYAKLDCADAKAAIGWSPVADRAIFIARGIQVHRPSTEAR